MKQYVMKIHFKSGATVCTPDLYAIKQRCKRLKAELKRNKDCGFRQWGLKTV